MTPDRNIADDTHQTESEAENTATETATTETTEQAELQSTEPVEVAAEDTIDDPTDAEATAEIETAKAAFDSVDDSTQVDDGPANSDMTDGDTADADSADSPSANSDADQNDAADAIEAVDEIKVDAGSEKAVVSDYEDVVDQDEDQLVELAQPFVGQWNQLISTTNWEKGRIISDWREALIASGAESSQYSDEAWTRRVGGVTAPHVGRLRRVHDRFASTFTTYEGLYWSHFLAALDWEDAPLWLEGASKESWSVSGMREQRWQAHGAVEENRPTGSQIIEVDLDEDVDTRLPAEGGGRTKEYGDEQGVASGPVYETPDFGDEDELMSLGGAGGEGAAGISAVVDPDQVPKSVQPFAGLPELPDDLSDAVESFKLAILRHKTSKWENVSAETVEKYLQAFTVLLSS